MDKDFKIKIQKHHWTSEEKIKWMGYGEWVEEPDVIDFEYLGYHALVYRILKREPIANKEIYFGGYLCGYVQIHNTHPCYRKEEIDIDCHGEITFNQAHEEHWIGFDCSHTVDYIPTVGYMRKTCPEWKAINEAFPLPGGYEKYEMFNPSYKNVSYCIEECKEMINQLIEIELS